MSEVIPESISTIPESVTQVAMNEALRPFLELIGITDRHVFATPGISIRADEITFVVPATTEDEWRQSRPPGTLSPSKYHPQQGAIPETGLVVSVKVQR